MVMKYAIWFLGMGGICVKDSWVEWTFGNSVGTRQAPYTDLNWAYICKEHWWPSSYSSFEVREISEEDIERIKKESKQ
jgi:hypothetical protein